MKILEFSAKLKQNFYTNLAQINLQNRLNLHQKYLKFIGKWTQD
ncbi:MAG: hypothetical protein ACTTIM_01905 [Campylobacter sp.]